MISDSAAPRNGDQGVPVTQVMSVQFTEPVTNVTESTVTLTELGDTPSMIPLDLIATKRDGSVGVPTPADEVVALTLTPRQGLKFAQRYSLVFSTAIVDLPSASQPAALALDDATNEIGFTTFTPTKLGEAPLDGTLVAMTTLDNLALVASQPSNSDRTTGNLQVFHLSDPTQPVEASEASVFMGSMVRDIAVEENVELIDGIFDVAAVLSLNPRSGNSGLTLFDVTSR